MSHTKGELIAMQMNLGLGHRGEIILTTQERIDNNFEPLAKDIFSEATAEDFCRRWNAFEQQPPAGEFTKEAIDTIEHLLIEHRQTHTNWLKYLTQHPEKETEHIASAGGIRHHEEAIADYDEALEVLTKLREAPEPLRNQPCGCILCVCDTEDRCLGCGAKMCEKHQKIGHLPQEEIVYPTAPEQPTAGDFTKEVRAAMIDNGREHSGFYDTRKLFEACDRLDSAEAENKQLKGEEPIPEAWWKDCPKLAQKTMERIIARNDELADRLDSAEASKTDLLAACEMAEDWLRSHTVAINRPAKLDKTLMDAIAKAKKGGENE